MGYIHRSQSSNLYIDTPIIGIPNEIIYFSTISGFSRYNGSYIRLETGSDLFLEMYTGGWPGLQGYSGQDFAINQLAFWVNFETNCRIHGFLDENGDNIPGTQTLYDYNYYDQRYSPNPGYQILFYPYFTLPYGAPNITGWLWDKNIFLLFAVSSPSEISGRNSVPGFLPQSTAYTVSVPFRTVLTNNQQNFIVQGNQFALNPSGGLPI